MNQAPDFGGRSVLWFALEHAAIMKLLLAHDEIGINKVLNDGLTAFHTACFRAHGDVVKLLLAAHARISANTAATATDEWGYGMPHLTRHARWSH